MPMKEFFGMPWLPISASAQADTIDQMIVLVHYLMIPLFVGWAIYFFYALYRFSAKRHPKACYEGVKGKLSKYLEVFVVLVEVVLLFGFSIPLWASYANTFPDVKDAIEIGIVAEQFAWNFHYAGADGQFGRRDPKLVDVQSNPLGLDHNGDAAAKDDIVTKMLHLPKDKPVIAHLTSKDVIHSLGIPVMRVKQDAIPGLTVPVTFVPTKTGKFLIACSQLCGANHSQMKGFLVVESQNEFNQWLAGQAQAASEAGSDDSW